MRLVIAVVVLGGLVVAAPRARAESGPAAGGGQGSPAPAAKSGAGASSRTAPPAAAQDLSRALVSNEEWNRVLDEYASGLAGHVADSLTARGDTVPEDLEPSIRKQLGQELPYEHVVDAQAQALAKQFTQDELKKAASFYGSPLGKKVTRGVPQAQSELGKDLQSRLASAVPRIVKRVAPSAVPGEEPDAGSAHAGAPGGTPAEPPKAGPSAPGRGDAGARGTGSTSPPAGAGAGEAQPRSPGTSGDRP